MSKRARTTRTGDINPQYLVADVVLGAFNDYAVGSFPLPVARIGGSKTKAIVFEILRVDWYFGIEDQADLIHTQACYLTTSPDHSDGDTSTLATIGADMARPQNFANVVSRKDLVVQGGTMENQPWSIDTSDGAGNGMLVATQNLTMVFADVDSTGVSSCSVHILYRLVEVGIQEYVGIVQSQS